MEWDKITAAEFEAARVSTAGVCLIPIGVLEKHGDNLPLGQDALYAHDVCAAAAELEPAMVFPHYYFSQIAEARHQPGTVAIDMTLQLTLLENICDEINRNGFRKIVLVNGHGGNISMLDVFLKMLLAREKPYIVFNWFLCDAKSLLEHFESKLDGHAGEYEISQMYAVHPELVRKNGIPGDYGTDLKRLNAFSEQKIETSMDWYASYPGHFAGEKFAGSVDKGKIAFEFERDHLVRIIRIVKTDDTPMNLYREFHARAKDPHCVQI